MKDTRALSRRRFLGRMAGFAAGTAAFPYIIPSSVYAARGDAAPNERLRAAIIGVGKMGFGAHVGDLKNRSEVQIVAVCDVETTALDKAKRDVEDFYAKKTGQSQYSGCDTYRDFREVLARDDIDIVSIATPDHWHSIIAIESAKAGKDIYCEKPLTRFIADGRVLVDTVNRYGNVFQVGSQQRSEFSGYFIRAAELVRAKAIGDLKYVEIGVGGFARDSYDLPPEPVPPTLDWDMWQGPAPSRPYNSDICPINYAGWPNWRSYSDYAGGGFSDIGAHHYDIAQWAMDMDHTGPVEIIPENPEKKEPLTFRYANGIPMYQGGKADCTFHGTEGTIFVGRDFLRSEPASILQKRLGVNDVHLNRHRDHRGDFLYCVRTRSKTIAPPEAGHRTSTLCQLGNIVDRLKRPLSWDPVAERFKNDEEANHMLSRAPRAPWRV